MYTYIKRAFKMGRRKKQGFLQSKMLASRVEESDYVKFEFILKNRDGKTLQEAINLFVVNYISGAVAFSGSCLVGKSTP
jgi:hypothetical protein